MLTLQSTSDQHSQFQKHCPYSSKALATETIMPITQTVLSSGRYVPKRLSLAAMARKLSSSSCHWPLLTIFSRCRQISIQYDSKAVNAVRKNRKFGSISARHAKNSNIIIVHIMCTVLFKPAPNKFDQLNLSRANRFHQRQCEKEIQRFCGNSCKVPTVWLCMYFGALTD